MNNRLHPNYLPKKRNPSGPLTRPLLRKSGSVLLLTLLIVSLLLVISLAFATYVRIELRNVNNNQNQQIARLNAQLAIELAIGRLQTQTGSDQRVTSPADLGIPTGVSGDLISIENYWNTQRNPNWTGAWINGNTSNFSPENPKEYNASPQLLSWLVSTPTASAATDPKTRITNLQQNSSPLDLLKAEDAQEHVLLVSPDPEKSGAAALKRAVTAPRVALNNQASGHYAWWVGDEGVKTRVDLIDPYASKTDTISTLRRAASAQRTGAEAMTGLASDYVPNNPQLNRIIHLSEFAFLGGASSYQKAIDSHFHDLTLYSRGVLSDTKHGGLKRDLTYLLGQESIDDLREAVDVIFPTVNGNDAISSSQSNRILNEVVTPLVTYPSTFTITTNIPDENPSMFAYTPTWEQLWSFYNMGNQTGDVPAGAYNGSGQAVPSRHTRVNHGIHPLAIQGKLFYQLSNVTVGEIKVDMRPLVVLANPYAVDLAPAEYTMKFRLRNKAELHFIERTNGNAEPDESELNRDESATDSTLKVALDNGGLGEIVFTIDSGVIPAGEARVYTLDSDYDLPTNSTDQAAFEVRLVNDFNPSYYLSLRTEHEIPESSPQTYATLFTPSPGISSAKLYLDYDRANPNDRQLLQEAQTHISSATENRDSVFLVYPTRFNREGGGLSYRLFDAFAGSQGQHSLFLQQNYRTNAIGGYHGYTSETHLLQWARAIIKKGFPGNEGYFNADLLGLTQDVTFKNIRWGAVNAGDPSSSYNTSGPYGLGADVGFRNWMYDIPTPDVPLASIGQLQHLNINSFIDADRWESSSKTHNTLGRNHQIATTVQSWQSNYTIGNSYANPRVKRNRLMDRVYSGFHYDGSYIWNDILWDRFYFSTYPTQGNFDFETDTLTNSRYQPFRDPSSVPWDDPDGFRGDGNPDNQANSRMAASNLLIEGAFNINSTSVDAWKALFASMRGVAKGSETDPNAPFARTLLRYGASTDAETANHANAWNGIRDLNENELTLLAEEMVTQVRLRGPFLSMSDFVNRKIVDPGDDPENLGVSGALQSAIDKVLNKWNDVDPLFQIQTSTHENHIIDPEYRATTVVDGFPGYLLQSDVLSVIGPVLTPRSDTFRIRAYGDAGDARAWCEVMVQRIPDYIDTDADEPFEDPQSNINIAFGRRYRIVSFRWLTPEEI
ncbi:hypothetical protein P3T73_10705 [Kiritimatiellota bacterium B12222]|nr:hypothetical protein P3T73_10705 [Kiritimatiellota bacterium B12222]